MGPDTGGGLLAFEDGVMMPKFPYDGGFFESARRVAKAFICAARNRLELFTLELQEERIRATQLFVLAGLALILVLLGVLLLTAVIIFLFPDRFRVFAAAGLGLLYLLGAIWTFAGIKARLQTPPFADTLSEFKKDFECWTDEHERGN